MTSDVREDVLFSGARNISSSRVLILMLYRISWMMIPVSLCNDTNMRVGLLSRDYEVVEMNLPGAYTLSRVSASATVRLNWGYELSTSTLHCCTVTDDGEREIFCSGSHGRRTVRALNYGSGSPAGLTELALVCGADTIGTASFSEGTTMCHDPPKHICLSSNTVCDFKLN